MESASLLSRESTTLSLAKPQKGHFIMNGNSVHCSSRKTWHSDHRSHEQRAVSSEQSTIAVLIPESHRQGSARRSPLMAFLLVTCLRELAQRQMSLVRKRQPDRNAGHKRHQPQEHSAANREF